MNSPCLIALWFEPHVLWYSFGKGKPIPQGANLLRCDPGIKKCFPCAVDSSCAHLEASASVRSPPCLKYASDSCSWGPQLAWQEMQLPCSSLQDFTEQCVCASNEIRLRLKPSIFMEYLLFVSPCV